MNRTTQLMCLMTAGALVLNACGGDDADEPSGASASTALVPTSAATAPSAATATSAATGTPDGSIASLTDVESAKALVQRFSQPVASVGVTEPASKKPEPGKEIVFLECPVPTCKVFGDGIEQATDLLDWELTRLTYQFTPEGQQSAFQQALDLGPDAIMSSGQTPAVTVQQRQAAAEAGIPFFDNSAVYENDPTTAIGRVDEDPAPPTLLLEPASFVGFQNGTLPAAWAIAQTDGNVHSIFVNVPDIPIIVPPQVSYEAALETVCPETCSNVVVAATVDEIGTTLPSKVVSTLQENPDTNYIVFTSGDFSLGVAAAVQAAGFDDVKLIGATPIQANVESMKAGGPDEAWAGVSNVVIGWRLVDGAVRYFNGDSIPSPVAFSPDDTSAAAWPVPRIYTTETAPTSSDFVEPADYAEIFSELWQLS
jgi:ribose transport system substrate-binding protein